MNTDRLTGIFYQLQMIDNLMEADSPFDQAFGVFQNDYNQMLNSPGSLSPQEITTICQDIKELAKGNPTLSLRDYIQVNRQGFKASRAAFYQAVPTQVEFDIVWGHLTSLCAFVSINPFPDIWEEVATQIEEYLFNLPFNPKGYSLGLRSNIEYFIYELNQFLLLKGH